MQIETPTSQLVANPRGSLLVSDTPISFWGGIDPANGDVIDEHHPLSGENVTSRLLAIPGSRGSCSGSSVLLELLDSDKSPAALIFCEAEEILVLGALIAKVMFDKSLPLLRIDSEDFNTLVNGADAQIDNDLLKVFTQNGEQIIKGQRIHIDLDDEQFNDINLSDEDRRLLSGEYGKAAEVSMRIVLRMAQLQHATHLIDITQAHIDGCVYNGLSNLKFAERLVEWGATVKVPTTLNALSVDQQQWRAQGIHPEFGEPASAVGDAYVAMGARKSFTCAPYLLNSAPSAGEQIVWAESNAVAYANSVLGAKTQKYPDFLDICIALTGRAPASGTHLDQGRLPTLFIDTEFSEHADDSYWPLLGYHVGLLAENSIPFVRGLSLAQPSADDLKAFSAAFATTSSVPMFHMAGVTPEAAHVLQQLASDGRSDLPVKTITIDDLCTSWRSLNTAQSNQVDMVCLGNPHFSRTEVEALNRLCGSRVKSPDVDVVVTLGRDIYQQCLDDAIISSLKEFGVQFVMDTCWCMLQEPVIPKSGSILMTNSGKYAHYGPGLVKRSIHFGSLKECVDAACNGSRTQQTPAWLTS
ncbi:MAG: aconitase X [Granulosicoccus sp.]